MEFYVVFHGTGLREGDQTIIGLRGWKETGMDVRPFDFKLANQNGCPLLAQIVSMMFALASAICILESRYQGKNREHTRGHTYWKPQSPSDKTQCYTLSKVPAQPCPQAQPFHTAGDHTSINSNFPVCLQMGT